MSLCNPYKLLLFVIQCKSLNSLPCLHSHSLTHFTSLAHLAHHIIMQRTSRMLQAAVRSATSRPLHTSPASELLGTLQHPGDSRTRTVSVFTGHGYVDVFQFTWLNSGLFLMLPPLACSSTHSIGPELTEAAMKVVDATSAPVQWEIVDNIVDRLTPEALDSIKKNKVALKGEFVVGMWPSH